MKSTMSLLWKEAEEARWYLYAGLAVFLVVPVFAEVLAIGMRDLMRLVVLLLGGLMAVFIAVGVSCKDFRGGVETFWRSRPIGLNRYLAIKYGMGLLVVLLVHAAALAAQSALVSYLWSRPWGSGNRMDAPMATLLLHSLSLLLIYSVAFLLGATVRRAVHAAILAVAAMLVIYFVPVLFPALNFLSVHDLLDRTIDAMRFHRTSMKWSALASGAVGGFAAVMLTASLLATFAAAAAVQRDWRLRLDLKLMAWVLGGVALLIFTLGAAQVGSNLPVERIIRLSPVPAEGLRLVISLMLDGERGVAAVVQERSEDGMHFHSIDLSQAERVVNPAAVTPSLRRWVRPDWDPANPRRVYYVDSEPFAAAESPPGQLTPQYHQFLSSLDLRTGEEHRERLPQELWHPRLIMSPGRLHLIGRQRRGDEREVPVLIFDLHSDAPPTLAESTTAHLPPSQWSARPQRTDTTFALRLPVVPGLSLRQRLEVQVLETQSNDRWPMEGDVLVTLGEDRWVRAWRLVELDESQARFALVGQREPAPLERLMHRDEQHDRWHGQLPSPLLKDGLLYVPEHQGRMAVTVYDLRDPQRPRRLGHYAAPDDVFGAMAVLPDNRLLLAGFNLHMVKVPR